MKQDSRSRRRRANLDLLETRSSALALDLEALEDGLLGTPSSRKARPEIGRSAAVCQLALGKVACEEVLVVGRDGRDELDVRADAVHASRGGGDELGGDGGVARGSGGGRRGGEGGEGEGAVRVGRGARERVEEDLVLELRLVRRVLLDVDEVALGEELRSKE